MGILLYEQHFRDVWSRNESVRAEIGQIVHTDTHTLTHAAKLVVEIYYAGNSWKRALDQLELRYRCNGLFNGIITNN